MRWIIALWRRLPVLVRAFVLAFVVLTIGTTVTALPLVGNLKLLPAVPWALPATILVVWLFWRTFAGTGWPASMQPLRDRITRRGKLPSSMWVRLSLPILLSLLTMLCLRLLLPSLFPIQAPELPIDAGAYPTATLLGLALSLAFSAGVVEEIAFRGYLQQPLEEAYGIVPALLLTGMAFWLAHVPKVGLGHLPFHLLASALLGFVVYRTRSLAPAIIGHMAGDALLLPVYVFHKPASAWHLLTRRPVWADPLAPSFGQKLQAVAQAIVAPSSIGEQGTQPFAVVAWLFLLSLGLTLISFKTLPASASKRGPS
ncbi:MAG TPA: type II CAAX endopeptidase family protein [Candidatus Polarisedimenticolia bacterium]|nr:type II CAAX endopeptidase family protein [Candidatus Polarisedimenticolia bacterium]